jgi:(1->4)-alpha-D-glucan 1-alpha-D-glucosylmutase
MAAQTRTPTATYRLQFSNKFTFRDALEIVPYLVELGISDIYSSPFFQSRPGSTHGYDVTNHNALNPEIGTREDLVELASALRERGMGLIVDFVPNHMGITDPTNEWWMDVLENGPSSAFAPFFDIDWYPVKKELHNKVLLPVLGDQYGKVLEQGQIHLLYRDGSFFVTYFDWMFPLNPRTYRFVLQVALENLRRYADEEMVLELESILTALEHLPTRTETDGRKVRERSREKEINKRRIARLCAEFPQVEDAIGAAIYQIQGRPGDPRSFDELDRLLEAQAYRLSFWRVAGEEINYRRFFDVNELAAIRVENPQVFATIHKLLFELLREKLITGVRIDHVDGLQNPKQYLLALRRGGSDDPKEDASLEFEEGQFYLIVEKILSFDERLRTGWSVAGTTGYDFAADVTQVLVASNNGETFSRIYREFIERYVHFESLIYEKKKLVMDVSLASDIVSLGHTLNELAERDRLHRDFTLDSLTTGVREVVACFPVYRTYISEESGVSEVDRQIILRVIRTAKRRNLAMDPSIFDYIRDVLLLENFANFDAATRQLQIQFVLKFQQCTGPIMAKGLEDTAFYIFNRLVALNEVGGSPQQFGISAERFHEKNRLRLADMPATLLAGTTHDTKRSEDVRARIAVLSEVPEQWETWIHSWRKINDTLRAKVEGDFAPSANEEYLLYQTLLGTWPLSPDEVNETYVERIRHYILKAIKEAKVNSSWIQPNEDWEHGVAAFVEKILSPDHEFRVAMAEASQLVAWHGMLNSLTQVILRLTSPGIPDFYQGTELWDFSLVDPDNRRPVDFPARKTALEQVKNAPTEQLFARWADGLIKLSLIARLLELRKRGPNVFRDGRYESLYATGPLSECCLAFSRRLEEKQVVVIVPRLTTRLTGANQTLTWKGTQLTLSEPSSDLKDLFTSRSLKKGTEIVSLETLSGFPFAVFQNVIA